MVVLSLFKRMNRKQVFTIAHIEIGLWLRIHSFIHLMYLYISGVVPANDVLSIVVTLC